MTTRLDDLPRGVDPQRDQAVDMLSALVTQPPLPRSALARVRIGLKDRRQTPRSSTAWRTLGAAAALAVALNLAVAFARAGFQFLAARAPQSAATSPLAPPPVLPTPSVPQVSPVAALPKLEPEERLAARSAMRKIESKDIEADLFQAGIVALHRDRNPREALVRLDHYLRRYPRGAFVAEANLAAVDAELALNEDHAALSRLEGFTASDFQGLPRADEVRVLRGELLARTGQWDQAVEVFGVSLGAVHGELRERALYGRALCRDRLGDRSGAETDLRSYVREFPSGRFATEVGRALSGL